MIRRGLLLGALIVPFLQGCSGEAEHSSSEQAVVQRVAAETMKIAPISVPSRYVTSGTVTSDHRVLISSRISGYIRDLTVREGDRVKEGAVLVRVDPVDAKQALVQASADFSNAAADLKRYASLFRDHAVSQQQLDRVRLRYKVAKSQVEQARNQLGYAEVRSPVDGVVVEKRLSKGDLASPGGAILVIEDPANLLVETYVSEQFIAAIHEGDRVAVEVAALHRTLMGTVRQVVQAADAVSHQFLIKVALPSDLGVRPGMYAQVGFSVGQRQALMIPHAAVVNRSGLDGVYLVDASGVIHYRQVRLGMNQGDEVEVLAGLHTGDELAWRDHDSLKTGMKVK